MTLSIKAFIIIALSIMALSIMTLRILTPSQHNTQHKQR